MLDIRNLQFNWPGATADSGRLAIVELSLAAGRTAFLYGPSGCGKSTLLGLMAGVLVAQAGHVSLLGQDWAALRGGRRDARRADHVGVIFQQFNLLPYLSVLDNVLLPCRFSALRARRCAGGAVAAAQGLLQQVGLALRQWEPDIWVQAFFSHLPPDQFLLIPDVRFPNEADLIRRRGGLMLRVEGDPLRQRGDGTRDDQHPSETALDGYPYFAATLHTTGSVPDLERQVRELLARPW